MTTNTYHQRSTAWRLLDKVDGLSFIPSIRWLRFVRWLVWLVAVALYVVGFRFDALLVLIVALAIEVMLFRAALVEVLKGRTE